MTGKARLGKGPVVPAGDFGLGLCLQCLGEVAAEPEKAAPPRFAVTLAPMPYVAQLPVGAIPSVVAVPACWEHLSAAAEAAQEPPRRPLLVAGGGGRF